MAPFIATRAAPHLVSSAAAQGPLWSRGARDWAEIQEGTCRAVYLAAFERSRLGPGMAYLDAGCGAGMAAHIAASRGAHATGIDAAEALLEIARKRTPSGSFVHGALESLPFRDNNFDLVTGFNSFQYAASPVRALREAERVTRCGGHVLVMTWGEPEGMPAASLVGALRSVLPAPPPGAPGPFALSSLAALHKLAAEAGLHDAELFDVDCPWHYPDLPTALRGLASSGVARRAIDHTSARTVDEAHAAALAPFLQADGSYCVGATFRCLLARVEH